MNGNTEQRCDCNPCTCNPCRCGEDSKNAAPRTESQPARCCCGTSCNCGDRCNCAPA